MANDFKVVVKRVFRADREAVFKAFTDPEVMSEWLFPEEGWKSEVSNTLEVGGRYSIVMDNTDCNTYRHTGEYTEIEPPGKLVFTWNSELVKDTLVSIIFLEVEGGTEVTLTHELFPDAQVRDKHEGGWNSCLVNLEKRLGVIS